jgi:hypothetical protein
VTSLLRARPLLGHCHPDQTRLGAAACPADRSTPGHGAVDSRGQAGLDNGTICSQSLQLTSEGLHEALYRLVEALRPEGAIYVSFKAGNLGRRHDDPDRRRRQHADPAPAPTICAALDQLRRYLRTPVHKPQAVWQVPARAALRSGRPISGPVGALGLASERRLPVRDELAQMTPDT